MGCATLAHEQTKGECKQKCLRMGRQCSFASGSSRAPEATDRLLRKVLRSHGQLIDDCYYDVLKGSTDLHLFHINLEGIGYHEAWKRHPQGHRVTAHCTFLTLMLVGASTASDRHTFIFYDLPRRTPWLPVPARFRPKPPKGVRPIRNAILRSSAWIASRCPECPSQ